MFSHLSIVGSSLVKALFRWAYFDLARWSNDPNSNKVETIIQTNIVDAMNPLSVSLCFRAKQSTIKNVSSEKKAFRSGMSIFKLPYSRLCPKTTKNTGKTHCGEALGSQKYEDTETHAALVTHTCAFFLNCLWSEYIVHTKRCVSLPFIAACPTLFTCQLRKNSVMSCTEHK